MPSSLGTMRFRRGLRSSTMITSPQQGDIRLCQTGCVIIGLGAWLGGGAVMLQLTANETLNWTIFSVYMVCYITLFQWCWRKMYSETPARDEANMRVLSAWLLPPPAWLLAPPVIGHFDVGEHEVQPPSPGQVQHVAVRINLAIQRLYFALSRKAAHRFLRSLKGSPTTWVNVDAIWTNEFSYHRWRLLCRTLGSIQTLRIASVTIGGHEKDFQTATMVIRELRQISHLELYQRSIDQPLHAVDRFAQALNGHTQLKSLEYCLSTSTYRDILPTLRGISTLKRIAVCGTHGGDCARADTEALVEYFSQGQQLEYVALQGLSFHSLEASRSICAGISVSSIESLILSDVWIAYGGSLADALASARGLTDLRLANWPVDASDSLCALLLAVALSLPTMAWTRLDLGELCGAFETWHAEAISAMLLALPVIVRAAARCTALEELVLPDVNYSEAMDDALVCLVQSDSSQLRLLAIGTPLKPPGSRLRASYPRFLQALKTNVTIQDVILEFRHPLYDHSNIDIYDPWCKTFRRNVEIITRLNKCGRGYLSDHVSNYFLGLQVLQAVNDDLDCLFFHLRECPGLFRPVASVSGLLGDSVS